MGSLERLGFKLKRFFSTLSFFLDQNCIKIKASCLPQMWKAVNGTKRQFIEEKHPIHTWRNVPQKMKEIQNQTAGSHFSINKWTKVFCFLSFLTAVCSATLTHCSCEYREVWPFWKVIWKWVRSSSQILIFWEFLPRKQSERWMHKDSSHRFLLELHLKW